jgi:circadian clock protein KaiC
MQEKLTTGIPGLDHITRGGIPRGRATLVCGRSGTCKSILSLQVARHLALSGQRPLLIAVEESAEDVLATGDSLGFELRGLMREGQLLVADLSRPVEGPTLVSGDYDLSGLVHRIEAAVRDHGVKSVVLDSSTALFSPRPPEEFVRSHFYQLVHALRRMGLTALVTAEAPADYGQLTILGVEDFVCDLVVVLRNLVDGGRRRRSIEIHKYRRSPHLKGEYPCTITSRGLAIFPLDAPSALEPATAERYSSGVRGLDEMTSGGWLRDSLVLVRGPSGSGKTTLAGMYARAGALRGEKVVYLGFEETQPILLRNFSSMGMPMEGLAADGRLQVQCRYPESTSPEDLLVELRDALDALSPSLVVIDSVSSIEHSASPSGFRQFMVGVASMLREHGRSALLTQTASSDAHDDGAPFLSTVADGILALGYRQVGAELERTLRVVKMRGSSHVTEQRRLTIIPGGLRVEPLQLREPALR